MLTNFSRELHYDNLSRKSYYHLNDFDYIRFQSESLPVF